MKKISIVIPVYNRKVDLQRCLESIQTTYEDYEVIVVDDASTDGSFPMLQSLDIKNMKVYQNMENRGVNFTRNRGIEHATGDYIFLLDSDDKLFPDGLNTIIKTVNENQNIKHFLFYVSDNQQPNFPSSTTTTYQEWLTDQVKGDFAHVIQKEVLEQYPFFEEFRAYENLNWLRILKNTTSRLVIPKIVTWMDRERTDNLTKTLKLKSTAAIIGKFEYLQFFFKLYGEDLFAVAPDLYKKKIYHALMLGIAAHQKNKALELIDNSSLHNKILFRSAITIGPATLLNKLITTK